MFRKRKIACIKYFFFRLLHACVLLSWVFGVVFCRPEKEKKEKEKEETAVPVEEDQEKEAEKPDEKTPDVRIG